MDEAAIRAVLEVTPRGYPYPTLTREEAAIRAKFAYEDIRSMGLKMKLNEWKVRMLGLDVVIAYYDLPSSDFGKELPRGDGCATMTAVGIGLTWGDWLQFSKACAIGHRLLTAEVWPKRFKEKLLSTDHYASIQEVLWLSKFRNPKNIQCSCRPFTESNKNVDWQFTVDGQIINLEVKWRPGDWTKLVDGPSTSPSRIGDFDDVKGKFPRHNDGQWNILAVTTLAPIDASLDSVCEELLERIPTIHGIIVWSQVQMGGPTSKIYSEIVGLIRLVYNEGDSEDRRFLPAVIHQWKHTATRQGRSAEDYTADDMRGITPWWPGKLERDRDATQRRDTSR